MPMEIPIPDPSSRSTSTGRPLWSPSAEHIAGTQIEAFRQRMAAEYSLSLKTYHDLWSWSIQNIATFWREVWHFTDILHPEPISMDDSVPVVDETIPMDEIPRWFPTVKLNFAQNLLRHQDDRLAIIYESEYGKDGQALTYAQLYQSVASVAAAMKALGVKSGDVVAAFAANCPEVVVFMLAAASAGAIFTTISPDFGPAAATDRLTQTKPRLLLASPAVYYNGKVHDQMGKIGALLKDLDSLERVILIETSFAEPKAIAGESKKFQTFSQFIAPFLGESFIDFVQLPFCHPLYVLYSSGTTGKPKCLVHSAGGTLLQHKKEHVLHGDLRRSSTVLQYTTIGWMMWHWLVSTLSIGATIVLYEGSPFRPGLLKMLQLVDEHQVTHFGTSAKYIQHLQESWEPAFKDKLTLGSLKTIYSTGSPLSAANFRFVYEALKGDLQLASITGGTDIISLFAGGNPSGPVYAGEIQGACLGMAIAAYSEEGKDISECGEAGDLVCTRPFPSMPVSFWNDDPQRSLYRSAYFDRFPHIWHHGDFVQFNPTTGGVEMLGRSDATLNPAGVRFGSAELYNVLSSFPAVIDSLVVGVRRGGESDERVFMFLQTAEASVDPSLPLDKSLVDKIKNSIRTLLSARHVPTVILPTPAIPYTLNGKKVEVAVKRILSETFKGDSGTVSLANPDSLKYYMKIAADPNYFPRLETV